MKIQFTLMALLLSCASPIAIAAPMVAAPAGNFEGSETTPGVLAFKGIRYASSPAGLQRWQPPRPPNKVAGTLAAKSYGPSCLQPRAPSAPPLSCRSSKY